MSHRLTINANNAINGFFGDKINAKPYACSLCVYSSVFRVYRLGLVDVEHIFQIGDIWLRDSWIDFRWFGRVCCVPLVWEWIVNFDSGEVQLRMLLMNWFLCLPSEMACSFSILPSKTPPVSGRWVASNTPTLSHDWLMLCSIWLKYLMLQQIDFPRAELSRIETIFSVFRKEPILAIG